MKEEMRTLQAWNDVASLAWPWTKEFKDQSISGASLISKYLYNSKVGRVRSTSAQLQLGYARVTDGSKNIINFFSQS